MLKINIICVGNIKDKFFDEAQKEYLKRLSKYCTVTVKELKEYNNLENIEQIKTQESENILQNVKGYFVLLDIKGTKISSEEFSKKSKIFSKFCHLYVPIYVIYTESHKRLQRGVI